MKREWWKVTMAAALVLAATVILVGCDEAGADDGGGSSGGSNATLVVQNDSSYTIMYLYVSPSSSSSWGTDQLGSSTIAPGASFTLNNIPPDVYDLWAENSTGYDYVRANEVFSAGVTKTWTLFNPSSASVEELSLTE